MEVRVSAPGNGMGRQDVEGIEQDLAKLDRRLNRYKLVTADVRVSRTQGVPGYHVVLELAYGRNHLQAKAEAPDVRRAVREAREDVLRQINDRSKRGHSSFVKHL
jgi:ribosome-associated translation inhibitor RaiA